MPAYSYTAFNNSGKKEKGFLSASSEREARKAIKDLNLTPISVKESNKNISKKLKVKNKDLVLITRRKTKVAALVFATKALSGLSHPK